MPPRKGTYGEYQDYERRSSNYEQKSFDIDLNRVEITFFVLLIIFFFFKKYEFFLKNNDFIENWIFLFVGSGGWQNDCYDQEYSQ